MKEGISVTKMLVLEVQSDYLSFVNDLWALFLYSITHCESKMQFINVFVNDIAKNTTTFADVENHLKNLKAICNALEDEKVILDAFSHAATLTKMNNFEIKLMKVFLQNCHLHVLSYAYLCAINDTLKNDLEKYFNFELYGKGHILKSKKAVPKTQIEVANQTPITESQQAIGKN